MEVLEINFIVLVMTKHIAATNLFCVFLILFGRYALAQSNYQKPANRAIAISGGGARGAWGLGVAKQLFEKEGGFRAVFGTSTGSLMAPMVLLQQWGKLEDQYTSVTQQSIFNKNPFKVKKVNGKVTTQLKSFNAIWRLIWGKPTLGETANLRNLIAQTFTPSDFSMLKKLYSTDSLSLNVAVTNMSSGRSDIRSSDRINDYNDMVDWIWASSNQPIFMSYTMKDDSAYVDGGVREIVPLRAAVNYSIQHHIDTLEVIINDSQQARDTIWSVNENKGYFKGGLMRVLEVYNSNTLFYNIWSGMMLTELHDLSIANGLNAPDGDLTIIIYSMPYALAATYRDELGFDKDKMKELLEAGRNFIQNKEYQKPGNLQTFQIYQATRKR